jgi:ribose 5-phosphate isomerase B
MVGAEIMRIAIGCDDTGFPLKEPLVAALEAEGHDVLDLGTFSTEPVDYPDYARAVGQAVLRGFVDASLLLCGSGVGGVIAANKMRGIRAALCSDAPSARTSREEAPPASTPRTRSRSPRPSSRRSTSPARSRRGT